MPEKKPAVEIVVPVFNEENDLESSILRLHKFLHERDLPFTWKITIADNASTDKSGKIGAKISKKYDKISYIYLPQKGRGRAVRQVWDNSSTDYFAYMDVDLSTKLDHFPSLIDFLENGYDIAIGSRLLKDSKVLKRPLKREVLSRGYNILIKLLFQVKFSDAQCGFKAVNKDVVRTLLHYVEDNEWFFDSELLIIGEKAGYTIAEEPVTWIDNPGSTVRVLKTVSGDLIGLWRLFWTRPWQYINKKQENEKA